jgi:hypothetical protein
LKIGLPAPRAASTVPMSGRILIGTRSRFGGPAFVEKRPALPIPIAAMLAPVDDLDHFGRREFKN